MVVGGSVPRPGEVSFAAAMNPCPCGYLTDPNKECTCNPAQVQKYMSKVSGPLLDRIDIHIEVPPVKYKELASDHRSESSQLIRDRMLYLSVFLVFLINYFVIII